MAKYIIDYAIVHDEEVCNVSEVEVSFTKKDIAELEQFVIEHNYSYESVDIPAHMYDKCIGKAFEKAMRECKELADPESGYGVVLGCVIPQSLLEALSEETMEKVYANIPEELKEEEEDETEEGEEEFEFPEPTKENTLYLTIKQVYFDQIIAGTKKEEYREIKDTTYKKYLEVDKAGYPMWYTDLVHDTEMVESADIMAWNEGEYPYVPKGIYYLDLAVGYNKVRDTAKVKVEDITFEPVVNPKTGKPTRFTYDVENGVNVCDDGNLCLWMAVFHLGEVVEKNIVSK